MKNILFISHDASRTGAPILLLRLIRILKEKGFKVKVIIRNKNGDLLNDFRGLADEFFVYNSRNKSRGLFKRFKNRIAVFEHEYAFSKILKNTDVLISNTITNGNILEHLKKYYKGPIVTYVHELEMGTKYFTTKEQVEKVLKLTDHFLVPSDSVKNFVRSHYGITESKVTKINSYVGDDNAEYKSNATETPKIRGDKKFIVGAVGTTDWRKGTELFVLVAKFFFERNPKANAQFIWKGFSSNLLIKESLQYDIKKLGLDNKVILEDSSFQMASFYTHIDVLLLTSREDPYPLVVLEAASFKKPTICFKDAGGAAEFIEDNAGTIVPYLSIEEMAEVIANYYNNRNTLLKHGQIAYEKVHKLHFDADLVLEQFKNVIEQL